MVREFKLINEKGQEYSLMDIYNNCLLTEPNGLGYSYTTEYEQIGNTFISNLVTIEQGQIEGTLNFLKYENYTKFINYIEGSEELKFVYRIPNENSYKEYYKDIAIQSITKTQIQQTGVISESVIFNALSLWYEKNVAIFTIEPTTDEIRWDFEWDSRFTDYSARSLTYINKGHVDAPVEIELYGELIKPKIELIVEGELKQTITFNIDIAQGEKILYGSRENNFYMIKEGEEKVNLFNLDIIDFANDNVIRLPKNKNSQIRLSAENDMRNAKITIYAYYKAV